MDKETARQIARLQAQLDKLSRKVDAEEDQIQDLAAVIFPPKYPASIGIAVSAP